MLTSKRCAMLLIAFTLLFVTSCSSCGSDPPPTSTPPPPDHQSSGFNFNEDAFVFANYGDSVQGRLLDAGLMTRMFGAEAVCADDAEPCELTLVAREWMKTTNATLDKGRSEGFATLSLLFFTGELKPEDFGGERVADLRLAGNTKLQAELAYWAATQSVPVTNAENKRFEAKDVLPFLAEALSPESEKHYRLAIAQRTPYGFQRGHALTPIGYYKPEGDDEGLYLLRVYDNNFPQRERTIEVRPAENSWRYEVLGVDGELIVYEGSDDSQNFLYFAPVEAKLGVLPAPFATDSETISVTYSGVSVLAERGDGQKTGIQGGEVFEAEGESVTPAFASCPLCGTPVAIVNQAMIDAGKTSVLYDIQAEEGVEVEQQLWGTDSESRDGSRFISGTGKNHSTKVYMDGDNFDDKVEFGANGDVSYEAGDNSGGIVIVSTIKDEETGESTTVRVQVDASETSTKVNVKRGDDGEIEVEVEGLSEGKKVAINVTKTGDGGGSNWVSYTSNGSDTSKTTLDKGSLAANVSGAAEVIPGSCLNGTLDASLESDVDCGGQCEACVDGKSCAVDDDCVGGSCTDGTCASSSCADGQKSEGETDVDCGGSLCLPCQATYEFPAPACLVGSDCTGGDCVDGFCRKKAPVKLVVDRIPNTARSGVEVVYELDGVLQSKTLLFSGQTNEEFDLGEAYAYRFVRSDFCVGDTTLKRTGKQDAQDMNEEGLIELDCPEDGQYSFFIDLTSSRTFSNDTYIASSIPADDPIKFAVVLDGTEQIVNYSGSEPLFVGTFTRSWDIRMISTPLKNYDNTFGPASQGGMTCKLYYGSADRYRRSAFNLIGADDVTPYPVTQLLTCAWSSNFGCTDQRINQDETDVNCGGSVCGVKCQNSRFCASDSDCASGHCSTPRYVCDQLPGTCDDAAQNQDETGVDCGGSICSARCLVGVGCDETSDCSSPLECVNNICAASQCSDGTQNRDETDVDCGGAICTARCGEGKACLQSSDCAASMACSVLDNTCTSDLCNDGIEDGNETDVDCGGATCTARCAEGKSCAQNSDCASGFDCINLVCTQSPCTNGVQDGDETDVDCGGSTCSARCGAGQTCSTDSDCGGGTCSNGMCGTSPCSNGIQDGDETDVDCGGNTCAACAVTRGCVLDSDCASSDCECGASSGNCSIGGACGAGQLFVDQPVTDGTSSSATFTIPAACTSLYVQAWGAAGGAEDQMGFASNLGGAGGYVDGTLSVTPGDTVTVWLGEGGSSGTFTQGKGSYLGASAEGGSGGFGSFGSDPGGGGGLTSVQITGGATQTFSVPAGAGASEFSDVETSVMITAGTTTVGNAGDAGGSGEGGGGAGDPGGASGYAGAYGTLPGGLTAYDAELDQFGFGYVPAGTSNNDYSRCQGANMLDAGAGSDTLGVGGDGCVILRCKGQ